MARAHRGLEQRRARPARATRTTRRASTARAPGWRARRARRRAARSRSPTLGASASSPLSSIVAGVQRLHRVRERVVQAVAREHELEAHRLEVRLRCPAAAANVSSAAREARERVRELGVVRVERLERLGRRGAPLPVGRVRSETAVRSASACSQHCASAPSAIIGSAVASCRSIAGRSMTSAHHAANGPSQRTSSTSPSAVPRVVSTRRQKSALSAPFERRRAARASRRRGLRACAARGRCRAPSGLGRGQSPASSPQASSA